MSRRILALVLVALTVFSSPDALAAETSSGVTLPVQPGGLAVGFEIGGGGLFGVSLQKRLGQRSPYSFEVGASGRPTVADDGAAWMDVMLSTSFLAHYGKGRMRHGFVVRAGSTPPTETMNSFVAAGWSGRLLSKNRPDSRSWTYEAGLGWFFIQRLPPGYDNAQAPVALYWRFTRHIHI